MIQDIIERIYSQCPLTLVRPFTEVVVNNLSYTLESQSNRTPAHTYVFSKLSMDNWDNPYFIEMVKDILTLVEIRYSNGGDIDDIINRSLSEYLSSYIDNEIVQNRDIQREISVRENERARAESYRFKNLKGEIQMYNNKGNQPPRNNQQQPPYQPQWGQPQQPPQPWQQPPQQQPQWGQPPRYPQQPTQPWGQPPQQTPWNQPPQQPQWGQPPRYPQQPTQPWGQPPQQTPWNQPPQQSPWGQPNTPGQQGVGGNSRFDEVEDRENPQTGFPIWGGSPQKRQPPEAPRNVVRQEPEHIKEEPMKIVLNKPKQNNRKIINGEEVILTLDPKDETASYVYPLDFEEVLDDNISFVMVSSDKEAVLTTKVDACRKEKELGRTLPYLDLFFKYNVTFSEDETKGDLEVSPLESLTSSISSGSKYGFYLNRYLTKEVNNILEKELVIEAKLDSYCEDIEDAKTFIDSLPNSVSSYFFTRLEALKDSVQVSLSESMYENVKQAIDAEDYMNLIPLVKGLAVLSLPSVLSNSVNFTGNDIKVDRDNTIFHSLISKSYDFLIDNVEYGELLMLAPKDNVDYLYSVFKQTDGNFLLSVK